MISLKRLPLRIRTIQPGDETGLVEFSQKNKDFFQPSGLVRIPDDLSVEHWKKQIETAQAELRDR